MENFFIRTRPRQSSGAALISSINGTANQITVTSNASTGAYTLSLPSTVNVANVQSTTLRVNGIEIDPSGAVSDQVLKFNGTKFVPAADVSGAGGGVSYEETIGNNTDTTFTITHSLNTKNIDVIVRDNVSPYEVVEVRWEATTNDTITLDFSAAPPNNSRRVEIKGPGTQDYYSATIGNGTDSTINLDHNLGTRSVVTVVRNAAAPYEVVEVEAYAPSLDRVTLDFSAAPTANSLVASVYAPSIDYSHESVIGDGSTTEFTITHDLNTRDIGVICRNTSSPYDFTVVKWEATTVNTAKIIFTVAPSTNSRKITIFNSFGGARYYNNEVTLDMLDDVTITSASNGQFLSLTEIVLTSLDTVKTLLSAGSKFIPSPPGVPGAITSGLADLESIIRKKLFTPTGEARLPKVAASIAAAAVPISIINIYIQQLVGILSALDIKLKQCVPNLASDSSLPGLTPLSDTIVSIAAQQTLANQTINETTYNGFLIEIETVPYTPTVNRYRAVGKNQSGITLVQTDLSFTLEPQILINELKLIIGAFLF